MVNNTSFVPHFNDNLGNFDLKLKDGSFRRWYYYFSDTAGPSVAEGINGVVKAIFEGKIGMIDNNNTDVSESIVKVAQRIFIDCPNLGDIFSESPNGVLNGIDCKRSYEFESIFLLRIKYIGDKSRCTDALFLNKNKYAECLQITGDENAYFTALINGASTIYSPPSKFTLYFAPYYTYSGKYLENNPDYKKILLKGESPTEFKISSSSSKRKIGDSEEPEVFMSSFFSRSVIEIGNKRFNSMAETGNTLLKDSNSLIIFLTQGILVTFTEAVTYSNMFNEVQQSEPNVKKKTYDKSLEAFNNYNGDYDELNNKKMFPFVAFIYSSFIATIKNFSINLNENLNSIVDVDSYYMKMIEQIKTIISEKDAEKVILEPVELTGEDFSKIKEYMTQFFNGIVNNESGSYNLSQEYIQKYKKFLDSLQIVTLGEFKNLLEQMEEFERLTISQNRKTLPWDNNLNLLINFVFSLSDINLLIGKIRMCKIKYMSNVDKYGNIIGLINNIKTAISSDTTVKAKNIRKQLIRPDSDITNRDIAQQKIDDLVTAQMQPSTKATEEMFKKPSKRGRTTTTTKESISPYESKSPDESITEPVSAASPFTDFTQAAKRIARPGIGRPSYGGEPREQFDTLQSVYQSPLNVLNRKDILETPTSMKTTSTLSKSKPELELPVTTSLTQSKDKGQERYRKNQIYILKCFSKIIQSNNELFINLLTTDKSNINYSSIKNINDYCVSVLMLQIYRILNTYTPKIESIQNILDDISKLNEDTTSLNTAINMRNYYSSIIDTFVNVEYIQIDAADYIIGLNKVEFLEGETIIYDLRRNFEITYYILMFIVNNLKLLSTPENQFIDNTDLTNFYVITLLFDKIQNIDTNVISNYYGLISIKNNIDSLSELTPDEKNECKKQISIVESYDYLCMYLIKYSNELFMKITNNQLNYSTTGLIYDYSVLLNSLNEEGLTNLVSQFNAININMNMNNAESISSGLFNMKETGDLDQDLKNIISIITGNPSQSIKQQVLTSPSTEPSGGKTYKNKGNKRQNKTKKYNKKTNKKVTIKRKQNKVKKNTKKHA